MELKAKYEQRIEQAEAELRQVKNKILRISTLRVLLFAAGIIGTIYFYQAGTAGGDKGTGCLFRFPGNIPDHRPALQRGDKRPRRN